jgi:hypothetical protein
VICGVRSRTGVICPVGRPVGRTPRRPGGRAAGLPVGRAAGLPGLIGLSVGRSVTIPNGWIRRVVESQFGRDVPRAAGLSDRTG